jgi:hypothetical protein
LPFNEERASRLTGSLPLIQKNVAGDVMFFSFLKGLGFAVQE